jgi:hypothetical protein
LGPLHVHYELDIYSSENDHPLRARRAILSPVRVRRGLLETVTPEFHVISENAEIQEQHERWQFMRAMFNSDLKRTGTRAQKEKWQRLYHRSEARRDRRAGQGSSHASSAETIRQITSVSWANEVSCMRPEVNIDQALERLARDLGRTDPGVARDQEQDLRTRFSTLARRLHQHLVSLHRRGSRRMYPMLSTIAVCLGTIPAVTLASAAPRPCPAINSSNTPRRPDGMPFPLRRSASPWRRVDRDVAFPHSGTFLPTGIFEVAASLSVVAMSERNGNTLKMHGMCIT